jgi:hypothetical protein
MKLETHPFIINSVFFLQLVDKALADITEGSDIVGKDFEVDHYNIPLKNFVEYTRDSCSLQMFFYKIWRKYYPDAKEGLKYFDEKRKNGFKIKILPGIRRGAFDLELV